MPGKLWGLTPNNFQLLLVDCTMFHTLVSKSLLLLANDEVPLASRNEGNDVTGDPTGASGGGMDGGGGWLLIMLVLLMMALFIPSIIANRREKKKREEMLSSIRKHDRVQTIGGVIGSVVEVKPNTVVLKVDESSNTRMTFSRTAIQQVLTENPDKDAEKDSGKEKEKEESAELAQ